MKSKTQTLQSTTTDLVRRQFGSGIGDGFAGFPLSLFSDVSAGNLVEPERIASPSTLPPTSFSTPSPSPFGHTPRAFELGRLIDEVSATQNMPLHI